MNAEPHLDEDIHEIDPSEAAAEGRLARESRPEPHEHSVWDEPTLSAAVSGRPGPGTSDTYAGWLEARRRATSYGYTWGVTALLSALAGPWAIVGAIWGAQTALGLMAIAVVGPLAEEVLKVSAAIYIAERRPYLFRSGAQIALCAGASGVVFACIENVMYLYILVPDPPSSLVTWRWTVCVALHTGCSLIAGMGVIAVWRDVWARMARPRLRLALPYTITAAVIHGIYNATATVFELVGGPLP